MTPEQLQNAFYGALQQYGRNNPGFGGAPGTGSPTNAPASASPAPGVSSMEKYVQGAGDAIKSAGKTVVGAGKDAIDAMTGSVDVWRNLSKTGAGFSNDIVGMSVAAANSRMSLNDFYSTIRTNGKDLAGLGGNVTRGAEAFGKLSKEFFDSRAGDSLKNLGYTSKDVNDVLALQLGTQRATFKNDEQGRKEAFNSAVALSKEMDALSKLTGKTREEQLEAAQKNRQNGEIEAKFRLIGINKGPEAEAAARREFAKNYAEAEARGMGQLAKDMFTKGFPNTEEAQMQYSMLGKAAQDTGKQFQALAKGNVEQAEAFNKSADAANAANQNNKTLLQYAALGDAAGSAGTVMKGNIESNMALTDSIKAVAAANGILLKSQSDYAKALDLVRQDIGRAQLGQNRQGQNVSGVTRGVVGAETAAQDIKSATATAAEAAAGPGARRVGNVAAAAAADVSNAALQAERDAIKGLNNPPNPNAPTPRNAVEAARQSQEGGGAAGTIARGVQNVSNFTADKVENIYVNGVAIGKKAGGGFVGEPEINLIGEAGPEFVLNNPQMKSLIEGIGGKGSQSGMSKASERFAKFAEENKPEKMFEKLSKAVPANQPTTQNIDLSAISKTVATSISTVSGGGSNTTRRVQSDDSKKAETELKSVKEQYAAERQTLLEKTRAAMGPDASRGDVRRAMNTGEEGKALEAKYAALMEPIEKKIEEGIKWEVEAKAGVVEETKKVIEEEISIKKTGRDFSIELETKTATEQKDIREKAREETLKQAELTRSIVGTNIKGMSDDAIEALLPAGTSMSDFYEDMDGNLQSWANDSAKKLAEIEANQSSITEIDDNEEIEMPSLSDMKADLLKMASMGEPAKVLDQVEGKMVAPSKSVEPYDEFKGLDEAIAKQAASPKIGLSNISFGAGGMPVFKQAEAAKKTISSDGKTAEADKASKPGEQTKPGDTTAKKPTEEKPTSPVTKTATLDDAVKQLIQLNKLMSQFVDDHKDLGNKQIRAAKSSSANVQDRI